MTITFPTDSWNSRVFFLSGLGSLGFHAMFIAFLASLSQQSEIPEPIETVQVNLVAPSQDRNPTAQKTPTPLLSSKPMSSPAISPSSSQRIQPPPSRSIQASLSPADLPSLPMLSQMPSPPILKDTQTAKILEARTMMKMKTPGAIESTTQFPPKARKSTPSSSNLAPHFPSLNQPLTSTLSSQSPLLPKHQILTAQPPVGGGGHISRPTVLSSSKPLYPRIARESGWEGTVVIRVLIETSGNPDQVQIQKSSGYRLLDHAAQTAIKNWTFQPAKDGNIPVAKWVDIPIKFDLDRS